MKAGRKISFMTGVIAIFGLLVFNSCGSTQNTDCIDESKISDGPCTLEYAPVCGCDGETYSNSCVAGRAGLLSWTDGKCGERMTN